MLETNNHVHVFTADHSPEIQFFYMLWNVFEGIFVRRGVAAPWPVRTLRFTIEELAAYRFRVELALRAARLFRLGSTFDEALRGLVRTVEAMTHAPEAAILSRLGMPEGISGQDFLGFLLERLEQAEHDRQPYPFDAVLAQITRELYDLHEQSRGTVAAVSQRSLLESFFATGPGGARADYERVVLLTVNFDCAFQGLQKYGLAVDPRLSFQQQVDDLQALAYDSALLASLEGSLGHPVRLLPFLCVDPRYQPPGGLDDWVRRYTDPTRTSNPFVGIKLYPPMGFSPSHYQLRSIFAWCKERSLPIVSHCSLGGAGLRGLEERGEYAHPRHWRAVIDELGGQGPGVLRINLAHLSDLSRSMSTEAASTWTDEIAALMEYCDQTYPDVEIYADLAYAWVEERDRPTFEQNIRDLLARNLGRFILFGSDYWNYLPVCTDEPSYLDNLGLGVRPSGLLDPAELEHNARRFLP